MTAAGQGIGREVALRFASEGAQVLATDVSDKLLQDLRSQEPTISTAVLDVTSSSDVRAVCDRQTYDVVANIAGCVHQGTILDCQPEDWRQTFSVNVDSMYMICRAVLPGMLSAGRGSIINMSSVASSIKGVANRFAYSASKAAVIGLTKSLAADFVSQGIRCNAICPGTVETPSLALRVAAMAGDEQEAWRVFRTRQPMGRLGKPQEIAWLALYLAADESAFTTGAVHVIDGGWTT